MSATPQRTSRSGRQQQQQSLFYRDLASPISAHRGGGRFATPGQAAAVSALWRENFAAAAAADPPPPPAFTLDDRADFSPEPEFGDLPPASPASTPPPPSPFRTRLEDSGSRAASGGSHVNHVTQQQQQQQQQQQTPVSSNWWSPVTKSGGDRSRDQEEKGMGSPVEGVVQPGALIMLPPPREVARPELQRDSLPPAVGLDEEEWVTVYGFSPGDTNLILREFEKCGVILKHVPGPRDSNWMHILYQNRYDAQKALHKNGVQIHSILIVGVKPVDPAQRQILNETLSNSGRGGFMVSLPPKPFASRSTSASPSPMRASLGPTARSEGAIATPSKSVVSKVMDLMFGI